MADAIVEVSSVAEESEFTKRKREDEEEEEVEEGEEEEEEEGYSCKYSEYGDVEEGVEEMLKKMDSYDDEVSKEYRDYCIQTERSEGFNVTQPPKGTLGAIYPLCKSDVFWPFAEEGAEMAVEHYNENRAPLDGKLQLVRLETANSGPADGMVYYLTFEAENVTSREKKMYQSKAFRRFDGYWWVLSFRKKKHAD